jgi:hypothetical protein
MHIVIIDKYLSEGINIERPFIVHRHDARNTNQHFDLRILHPYDDKDLMSFAFGKDFEKEYDKKVAGVRTKDHDPRWLELKSYRLENFDEGTVTFKTYTYKFMELEFKGKKLKGNYKLFKVKSDRGDNWLLLKK